MDLYHPEDMSVLKEVYETLMLKGQTGASFYGKPYRFLTHNGCYVTVETEWSSFVNPWSHHLEFVIGYHRVLRGPSNPNVLVSTTPETQIQFSENVLAESKIVQCEILKMLQEPITRPSDTVKQQVSKRCQVLANFMENLMDEVTKSDSKGDLKLDLPLESHLTFSERDSVMLGEISPHHDYFDSKSSSETPPSYNQLNYNENLQRFFDSRPVTTTAELEQQKLERTDTEAETRANLSPIQCFGESGGSESAGNMSSASNANMESITNTSTGTSNGSYQQPALTEALLCKHNEDMEKLIIKRHKFAKTGKCDKNKKGQERPHQNLHDLKRSGSHSWEGEAQKTFKHQHMADTQKSMTSLICQPAAVPYNSASFDLWPPFSVSLAPLQNTQTNAQATHFTQSNIFPTIYYVPQNVAVTPDQRGQLPPMQYVPSVIYQPMMYPHPSPFYQMPFSSAIPTCINDSLYNSTAMQFDKNTAMPATQNLKIPTPIGSSSLPQNTVFQRPPSQATSVKADMGSTSASVVNRV